MWKETTMKNIFLIAILLCACLPPAANSGDGGACAYHQSMSHTLTPTSQFSTPITVPDDGDACNAASVETPFQSLTNRSQLLYEAALNVLHRPSLSSTDGTSITIGDMAAVMGTEGGTWKTLAYATSSYSPAGLANSTWYYLYARITGGSVAISHSTTAPSSTLRNMNGNTDYAYLGAFRTDGSGVIIPFYSRDGKVRYTGGVGALNIGAGVTNVYTDLSLSVGVPPHVRIVTLYVIGNPDSGAGTDSFHVLTKGVTAFGYTTAPCYSLYMDIAAAVKGDEFNVVTNRNQQIQYKFQTGGGTSALLIFIKGYQE